MCTDIDCSFFMIDTFLCTQYPYFILLYANRQYDKIHQLTTNYDVNNKRLFTQSSQNSSGPEHFAAQRRQEEQSAHSLSEAVLQRVQHRHVTLFAHLVRKKYPAWFIIHNNIYIISNTLNLKLKNIQIRLLFQEKKYFYFSRIRH